MDREQIDNVIKDLARQGDLVNALRSFRALCCPTLDDRSMHTLIGLVYQFAFHVRDENEKQYKESK